MNKIYRLKFDRRRNRVVVVSELATGAGKDTTTAGTGATLLSQLLGTLTPLALFTGLVTGMLPAMVLAETVLPSGGQVVAGSGSISSAGNRMTIQQHSEKMVATWSSFDIGKGQAVEFVQPGRNAVALNRVTGGHESRIMGSLQANGQVILVNPAGVMFGQGARVNTAGLVASTKNISNTDFLRGAWTFRGGEAAGAEVVNQGSLTTSEKGYIVLAADRVKNSGSIRTPGGKAVLAAGESVTLQLDNGGLTSVSVKGSVVKALAENSGLMSATDGQVYLTARGKAMLLEAVVNNSGTAEAKGLESRGGEIVLSGGDSGVVKQSGHLVADSRQGRGGRIVLEGENIHLATGSRTSATGKTGGGEVYVGGGWQGKDGRIKNASKVVMDKTATVDVSATDAGNGGTAVLWSDDYTNFRGTVLAKGGAWSGNGGRVETSSHKNLQAFGEVDASAHKGRGGEWLLDPTDVSIVSGDSLTAATDANPGSAGTLDTDTDHMFRPSGTGAQIGVEKITAQLNRGTSVTVKTSGADVDGQSGNISVNANITKTAGTDATLTLMADGNIVVGGNGVDAAGGRHRTISSSDSGGKLGLKLLAGGTGGSGSITLGRDVNISLNGGDFYAGPGVAGESSPSVSLQFQNNGKINAGNITMDVAGGMTGSYSSLEAKNNLTVKGPVSVMTGWGVPVNITAGDKLTLTAPSGNMRFISKDPAAGENPGGGKILISGKNGVDIKALNGSVTLDTKQGPTFGIDVKSDKDIVISGNGGSTAVGLTGVNVSSSAGNININGTTGGDMSGVRFDNVNLRANVDTGDITVYGESRGGQDTDEEKGSVYFGHRSTFNAKNINITGKNLNESYIGGAGIVFDSFSNVSFSGKTSLNASAFGLGLSVWDTVDLYFEGGNASIKGQTTGKGGSDGYYRTGAVSGSAVDTQNMKLNIHLKNVNLDLTADATSTTFGTVPAFGLNNPASGNRGNGLILLGEGDVKIIGKSTDGNAIDTRIFDNTALNGHLTIQGESKSGAGVYFDNQLNVKLVNASVTGRSESGSGLILKADSGNVNLNNSTLSGTS
ncbi:filamentous hemagglutinin N-terminal domain-containing protein, partial [Salmonella enterica]|nr:filamentous hemagglutinin N-terminal domain-containing protein [Salmonella enterica]